MKGELYGMLLPAWGWYDTKEENRNPTDDLELLKQCLDYEKWRLKMQASASSPGEGPLSAYSLHAPIPVYQAIALSCF